MAGPRESGSDSDDRRGLRRHPAAFVGALLCLLGALALGGCKVTKDQVRGWGDSKDAFRLAKVIKDGKQAMDVRQEAAYQLVRIDRFFELEKALKAASRGDGQAIAADLAKRLLPHVLKGSPDPADVVRAKDGLFSAWYFAKPKLRRQIEKAVTHWIVNGPHGEGGDHPIQKILKAFGRRGANLVAALVPPDHPQLYAYDKKTVVAKNCLLGYFWKTAGPSVRAATARRYMQAVRKNKALVAKKSGAVMLAIGALGSRAGVNFLLELLNQDKDVKVRAYAAVALRIAAQSERALVGNDVRDSAMKELHRLMKILGADKPLPNPTVRGVSYLEHLLELTLLFKGEPVFAGLTPIVAAPYIALKDPDLQGIRTFLRLLTINFLMRLDPKRALRLAYAKLPPEEQYPLGYLRPTVIAGAVTSWQKKESQRKALLAAFREGLTHSSWVAKIIAVEGLATPKLTPRKNKAADLASLKKMTTNTTVLKGEDWQGATLGAHAKKAVEILGKTK